ncbi:uncharacterized protein STEHIDRAFT_161264 [Stereum hirsutum FP-91666 SS1]|uniref:uncharacterized protein n=1 Tax=Stereum hirsutum (strain FP-91666) TaxID=721885 RepID=UPI00044496E3|nr:uncharacterized protein STEHIDRAFT_161264 [Stereum hirsutum FP-91666 SS1]EIM81910.1 hypothetical protein STEHIDRAFT_161264 [Stereum hirsutum FP-91666 SS1]
MPTPTSPTHHPIRNHEIPDPLTILIPFGLGQKNRDGAYAARVHSGCSSIPRTGGDWHQTGNASSGPSPLTGYTTSISIVVKAPETATKTLFAPSPPKVLDLPTHAHAPSVSSPTAHHLELIVALKLRASRPTQPSALNFHFSDQIQVPSEEES